MFASLISIALAFSASPGLRTRTPAACAAAPRMCTAAVEFITPETPPLIESQCGFDHVPLSIALQTGDFYEADQITRDSLIKLMGERAVTRGYVYFSEVANIPEEDLATIERLWLAYSGGKFGYTVQAKEFASKKISFNLEKLFARIGWMHDDVRAPSARWHAHPEPRAPCAHPLLTNAPHPPPQGQLLRWLPEKKNNEFIYELEKVRHVRSPSAERGVGTTRE